MIRPTRPSTLSALLLVALSLGVPVSMVAAGQPAKPRQGTRVPAPARDRSATIAPSIRDNAALVYYSIWMNDNREVMAPFMESYGDVQYGKALPKPVADYLALRKDDISRMVRAGKMQHCDFGIDRGEGFNVLLPHLGKLRMAARTLNADAARCLLEGKPDEAADRYVAIFGLARHAAGDRLLISSLVGIAIATLPEDGLVDHKVAWQLTPSGRARVLAAIDRLDGAAGFRLKDALEGEREMAVELTIFKYGGPDAGRRFADEVLSMAADASPPPPAQPGSARAAKDEITDIERIRQMDGEALHAEARKLNRFYVEASKVWDAPDATQRLRELVLEVDRGGFGLLAGPLLPGVTRSRISQDKGVATLERIAAALRQADAEAAADATNKSTK
ncbi:MAG: hypothetical protein Q8L55_04615 [Phycisphaerales bacterium]|nr:hypothetical protein [Phycisphaerales bacterium]